MMAERSINARYPGSPPHFATAEIDFVTIDLGGLDIWCSVVGAYLRSSCRGSDEMPARSAANFSSPCASKPLIQE